MRTCQAVREMTEGVWLKPVKLWEESKSDHSVFSSAGTNEAISLQAKTWQKQTFYITSNQAVKLLTKRYHRESTSDCESHTAGEIHTQCYEC